MPFSSFFLIPSLLFFFLPYRSPSFFSVLLPSLSLPSSKPPPPPLFLTPPFSISCPSSFLPFFNPFIVSHSLHTRWNSFTDVRSSYVNTIVRLSRRSRKRKNERCGKLNIWSDLKRITKRSDVQTESWDSDEEKSRVISPVSSHMPEFNSVNCVNRVKFCLILSFLIN